MELYPVNLKQLHVVESGEFIVRFLTDFDNQGIDATQDAEINYFYNNLKTQSPVYNKAIAQIRAKAESEELMSLDENRDRKMATLRRAYNVAEYSDEAEEKAAYGLLKPVFDKYKAVERMNFEAETLALDNLVNALRDAKYTDAVNSLQLKKHIDNIETANEAFRTTFNKRSTDTISEEVFDTQQLRKSILQTYRDAAEYAHVMAKRKNTPYYKAIVDTLNGGRKYYADILARR